MPQNTWVKRTYFFVTYIFEKGKQHTVLFGKIKKTYFSCNLLRCRYFAEKKKIIKLDIWCDQVE